jgi:hypothetical protein
LLLLLSDAGRGQTKLFRRKSLTASLLPPASPLFLSWSRGQREASG